MGTFYGQPHAKHNINRSSIASLPFACVHLVFVTKYRRKILVSHTMLHSISMQAEVRYDFWQNLCESNGDADHVHMLIEYPPTVQLSVLLTHWKAVTSRRLRTTY